MRRLTAASGGVALLVSGAAAGYALHHQQPSPRVQCNTESKAIVTQFKKAAASISAMQQAASDVPLDAGTFTPTVRDLWSARVTDRANESERAEWIRVLTRASVETGTLRVLTERDQRCLSARELAEMRAILRAWGAP